MVEEEEMTRESLIEPPVLGRKERRAVVSVEGSSSGNPMGTKVACREGGEEEGVCRGEREGI